MSDTNSGIDTDSNKSPELRTVETEYAEFQVAHDEAGKRLGPAGYFILKNTPPLPGSDLDNLGIPLPIPEIDRNLEVPPSREKRVDTMLVTRTLSHDSTESVKHQSKALKAEDSAQVNGIGTTRPLLGAHKRNYLRDEIISGRRIAITVVEWISENMIYQVDICGYCGGYTCGQSRRRPHPFFSYTYDATHRDRHENVGFGELNPDAFFKDFGKTDDSLRLRSTIDLAQEQANSFGLVVHDGRKLKLVTAGNPGSPLENDPNVIAEEKTREAMEKRVREYLEQQDTAKASDAGNSKNGRAEPVFPNLSEVVST